MSKQRRSAYGAPQEQKEVEITLDRRLAFGGGLVLLLVAALGAGYWFAQRGGGPESAQVASVPNSAGTLEPPNSATIQADVAALGLPPDKVVVVTPIAHSTTIFPVGTPAVPAEQPLVAPATVALGPQGAQPMSTADIPLPPGRPDSGPDAAAGQKDPNLSAEYAPLRPEDVAGPQSGPRIAISDLNEFYSYNFGTIPMAEIAEHEFEASNVGDKDLVISRIYASCGCTATVFGGDRIKPDGFLPAPVTLKPGESRPFTVQFDPRAEDGGKPVTQMKYIQIYTNDPTRFLFDDTDPLSYEVRFRIVMQPQ